MSENKPTNELQVILQEQGVSKSSMEQLIEAFGAPFTEAGEILVSYTDIKVTSELQLEDMAKAREQRLTLKRIRTGVEATRKELKEDALKAGKAIDSVARYIKTNIEPAEQYLELQEKFVEIQKAEAAATLKADRLAKLAEYNADPAIFNLDTMTPEAFEGIIKQLEATRKQELLEAEAAAKAEEEARLAKEAEDQKMREENARLKAEEDKRQAEQTERITKHSQELKDIGFPINEVIFGFRISGLDLTSDDKTWDSLVKEAKTRMADAKAMEQAKAKEESDRQAEFKRLSTIRVDLLEYAHNIKTVEDADNQAQRMEKYADSLAPADRENSEVSAAYHKSKSEIVELKQFIIDRDAKAEADRKVAEEAKAKAEADEAERKAMLSPDKDKLVQFAAALEVIRSTKLPAVQSNQAQQIVNTIDSRLTELQATIKEQAAKL